MSLSILEIPSAERLMSVNDALGGMPSTMIHLKWPGVNVFVYDINPEASGEPIIFLHGIGDEADTWRHVVPLVNAGSHRLVMFDQSGFGRSDKPDQADYSVGFFTWVTLELMEALGIRSAAFIGHSMGAQIASWIAVTHPDRVTRLMLIGGGLLQPPRPPLLARIFMGIFLLEGWGESRYAELRKDPVKAYESLRPYYADLDTIPLKDREFLARRVQQRVWSDAQMKAFFRALRCITKWVPRRQAGLLRNLNDIKVPSAVVCGEKDVLFPAETAARMAKMMPTSKYTMIPNCGHNVQQEKPHALADAIMELMLDGAIQM